MRPLLRALAGLLSLSVPGTAAVPASAADPVSAAGNLEASVPFELIDNRIFVDVRVNGRGPYRFILDTGGVNIVTPEIADLLGLARRDSLPLDGAGGGKVPACYTDLDSLSVGAITMRNQEAIVVSFRPIQEAMGFERMDGLLGYELFSQFVADIDYDAARIDFSRPGERPPPSDAVAVPFEFRGHIPKIRARLDGREGDFVVDTGDRSSLTIFTPYQRQHGLPEADTPRYHAMTGYGIGGPIRATLITGSTLAIGPLMLGGILTRLPDPGNGAFDAEDVAGSIGTGVLKRFQLRVDYPGRTLWLKPGAQFGQGDACDRSGFWLARRGAELEVMDVVPNGPADAAGLVVDDRIVRIDGAPVDSIALPAFRRRLAIDPPGTEIEFLVRRGTDRVPRGLVLRDLLPASRTHLR